MIYLNYSDGRKPKLLNNLVVKNPSKNFNDFDDLLKKLLKLQKSDFLSFSQNLTSSLIFSLKLILKKNPKYNVLISTHEIKWFKTLFEKGNLPIKETTYPNYVKQNPISFIKKDVSFFDPEIDLGTIDKIIGTKPTIIILSHVSRMTGQKFITEKIYQKIKKLNSENILVVDGSQSVGILPVSPKKVSDIYLGVTSKFINAEPHIGFCYISSYLQEKFHITNWTIDEIKYFREIYSALYNLKKNIIDTKKLKLKQLLLEKNLTEKGFIISKVKNQVDYIVITPWQKNLEGVIDQLSKSNISVFHNQRYSIAEPKIPGIRISFTTQTKDSDLKKFVKVLDQIKKSRT